MQIDTQIIQDFHFISMTRAVLPSRSSVDPIRSSLSLEIWFNWKALTSCRLSSKDYSNCLICMFWVHIRNSIQKVGKEVSRELFDLRAFNAQHFHFSHFLSTTWWQFILWFRIDIRCDIVMLCISLHFHSWLFTLLLWIRNDMRKKSIHTKKVYTVFFNAFTLKLLKKFVVLLRLALVSTLNISWDYFPFLPSSV